MGAEAATSGPPNGPQNAPACFNFFKFFEGRCPFEPPLIVRGGLVPPPLRYPRGTIFKDKRARKKDHFFMAGTLLRRMLDLLG